MSEVAAVTAETVHHQPCLRLRHACGDTVLVALHGAHVLSWTSGGAERLYLSPEAVFDGRTALRGGVPLCWPQFNMRGKLPKHGFAHTATWTYAEVPAEAAAETATEAAADGTTLVLQLHSSPATLALWPHAFTATLRITLAPGTLQLAFTVDNTGDQPMDFALALHTYFRVHDVPGLQLLGLAGQPVWDDLARTQGVQPGPVVVGVEIDSVFQAAAAPLTLVDGAQQLRIAQSYSLADTVVWNPGAVKCGLIADMPADGYQHMLCVEAAQVNTPVTLAPGAQWTGTQSITVL